PSDRGTTSSVSPCTNKVSAGGLTSRKRKRLTAVPVRMNAPGKGACASCRLAYTWAATAVPNEKPANMDGPELHCGKCDGNCSIRASISAVSPRLLSNSPADFPTPRKSGRTASKPCCVALRDKVVTTLLLRAP